MTPAGAPVPGFYSKKALSKWIDKQMYANSDCHLPFVYLKRCDVEARSSCQSKELN